jgi:hypothetical protein
MMLFVCLVEPELVGIKVRWSGSGPKSQRLINAARAAGFSDQEIEESPLGMLEDDFVISATEIARAGSVALGGPNGSMLLDTSG